MILNGDDVTALAQHQRVKRGLARTFQINRLFADMTVLESVTLAVCERRGLGARWWRPLGAHADALDEAAQLLAAAARRRRQRAHAQPGLRQAAADRDRAGAGRAAAVLLLDEPAAGVPTIESRELFETIARLPRDVTIVLIEHDMDLVFRFADRISVLVSGALLTEGRTGGDRARPARAATLSW